MNNNEKLHKAFVDGLAVEADLIKDELEYNSIPNWDSAAHMVLIVELEKAFDVMLDTDDIIDMSSVKKAREILVKYGVDFP